MNNSGDYGTKVRVDIIEHLSEDRDCIEIESNDTRESIEEHESASEKDRLDKLGKDNRLVVIMLIIDILYIELHGGKF